MNQYKVYISGAITGRQRRDVVQEFTAAEELWRTIGVDVVNPLSNGLDESASWREHMKADTNMLWDCSAVHLLPGWELSRGARVEYQIARESGMDIYIAKDGIVNVDTYNVINGIVRRENILRVLRIAQAIRRTFGVTFTQIQDNRRTRPQFFARMIFAHECRSMMSVSEIATVMKTQGHSVRYFLRKFNDEERFNHEFARMNAEIRQIIKHENNDIGLTTKD